MTRRTHRVAGAIGQEIDALWAALDRQRLLPGVGQRVRQTSGGVYLDTRDCCAEFAAGGGTEPPPPPDPTGSCCQSDGTCAVTTEAACFTPGVWTLAGVCSPNPCPPPPPPTGSCCIQAGGYCLTLTEAACAAQGGSLWVEAGSCEPNPCPPSGRCCRFSSPGIVDCTTALTESACVALPDSLWTLGADCFGLPNSCSIGACCAPDGTCTTTDAAGCPQGSVFNHNLTCAEAACSPPPPTGRCCGSTPPLGGDSICTEATEADCVRLLSLGGYQGTWGGAGTTCAGSPCGRCCVGLEDCFWRSAAECVAMGGTWAGAGTTCAGNPCQPPSTDGACCNELGVCVIAAQANCLAPSVFMGIGTVCTPNPCAQPVTGTCCLSSGQCIDGQTAAQCSQQISQPATWTQGATCAQGGCGAPPVLGKCCSFFGTCLADNVAEADCLTMGGVWTAGAACADPLQC